MNRLQWLLLTPGLWSVLVLFSSFFGAKAQGQIPNVTPAENFEAVTSQVNYYLPPTTAYTLGAGDRVQVDIIGVAEYSGEYQVLIEGNLNLPVVGIVNVQGLTVAEADQRITNLYTRYLRRPQVTVNLLTPRPLAIAIAGEVNHPGSYKIDLAENTGATLPKVTDIIELAGGITRSADVRTVQIRRGRQVYSIDLWQLFASGDLQQNVTLRDGDSIYIPTGSNIDPFETRQLAA
ncbi:MAG: polysaccharide export protein, partial [Okeania sp. SIO2D1]|nr:polysaccharide export protein [Okeania sp. SIO2D1]